MSNAGTPSLLASAIAHVRTWALTELNPVARIFIIGIDALAILVTAGLLLADPLPSRHLSALALLTVLGLGYAFLSSRVEAFRRMLGMGDVLANHISVWAFAGALILPDGYAAVVAFILVADTLWQARRRPKSRRYRVIFAGCATVVSTIAASMVMDVIPPDSFDGHGRDIAALVALIVFFIVNLAVMMTGVVLATQPESLKAVLPKPDEIGFEMATLVLGLVTGMLIEYRPWLSPIVIVLLAVLHRSSMVRQLQVLASSDPKTGLLNGVIWQRQAEKMLARVQRSSGTAAVLILDLDHFKRVNDAHGHQAGDDVLKAVAQALRQEVRAYDALSRFGGEEFVAFLDGVDEAEAVAVAERIRGRIANLNAIDGVTVTASVGIAMTSGDGDDITTLLAAADAAMYRAKDAGRDQVVTAWS